MVNHRALIECIYSRCYAHSACGSPTPFRNRENNGFFIGKYMNNFWFIEGDFLKHRSTRIGASDIPKLLPNPAKPTESLAGYEQTPITLWQEKTGRKKRDSTGLAASMGHWVEPKIIHEFARGVFGDDYADEYLAERMRFEVLKMTDENRRAVRYQEPPLLHNVQWYNNDLICHPDGIYIPPEDDIERGIADAFGLKIDLDNPFLLEAKNASFFSAFRRDDDIINGYDAEKQGAQGIPLKHLAQIQFQLACFDVDVCYLALIYDSNKFGVWEVKRDRKTGDRLIDIAGKMAWHIKHDKEPYEFIMNAQDVIDLYGEAKEDFKMLSGSEAENAIMYAKKAKEASEQEKIWKQKGKDAKDALAVVAKDYKYLKTVLDGEAVDIAQWVVRQGGERITALSEIEKTKPEIAQLLRENGLVEMSENSQFIKVNFKG